MPALGAAYYAGFQTLPINQMASFNWNNRSDSPQMFGHTLRSLTFADKCIGAGGECGLLTGVQVADEDNDQHGRAGIPEFFKSSTL